MNDTEPTPSETGVIRLNTVEEFTEHSAEVLCDVIRTVNILATDLDKPWLGHDMVVDALKRAVITNRRVQVRILMTDPTLAIRLNHPLLALIKKLSRIEARVIQEDILDKVPLKRTFILVDRDKLVVKQTLQDYVGFAHFDDKHSVQNLTEEFDQYWRYSETHADLRHVYI